jgi:hypothetical protein
VNPPGNAGLAGQALEHVEVAVVPGEDVIGPEKVSVRQVLDHGPQVAGYRNVPVLSGPAVLERRRAVTVAPGLLVDPQRPPAVTEA